ncbi:MAG TPA: glutathione S-transferase C-terminal domain-containing protein, partial [Burkholderiales bacterium]|nr:glutathione S-transferase C-terminal domain-containing protein [Burkholderiales bacterium]
MGLLVDGQWRDQWYDTKGADGRFVRPRTAFRNWVTRDGTPGPSGSGGFAAEPGRYRLYVSLACPWAHRTLILRALKGLEQIVPASVVHWRMLEHGWTFEPGPGVIPDPVLRADYLYQLYLAADRAYTGRVTTPVLWDTKRATIVNNESAEILRMFNSAFDAAGARAGDFYPAELRGEIDALNARIYETVNDGVYRAGFATSQAAYEDAVARLFETLDWLEERLAARRYLCGSRVTEADVRLLVTLLRFDLVYYSHFKCNLRR